MKDTTIPIEYRDVFHELFYGDEIMPCCGNPIKYFEGPEGACSTNIKCFHCGQKWNICPPLFIEKI